MEKYTDELNNIELFRYLYNDFPPGKLIRAESPDFIVKDGPGNTLGIEITHVMDRLRAEQVSSDTAENRAKKRILLHAREIFEYYSDMKLNVALYFNQDCRPKTGRIIPSAGIIARSVLKRSEGKRPDESFHLHFRISELEDLLESVTIFRFPSISESGWIDAGAYTLPEIESGMIEKTIIHKEEKLKLYHKKRLRYYWLLLIVDTAQYAGTFIRNTVNIPKVQDSGFNKVFLIERREGKLFELS